MFVVIGFFYVCSYGFGGYGGRMLFDFFFPSMGLMDVVVVMVVVVAMVVVRCLFIYLFSMGLVAVVVVWFFNFLFL